MNTLTHGFLYTVGMGWALCECCLVAGNGNWLPLILFLAAFIVIFSAIGCLDLSDAKTSLIGNVFAIVMGFTLLAFSWASRDLSIGVTALKFVGAILITGTALIALLPSDDSENHQHG